MKETFEKRKFQTCRVFKVKIQQNSLTKKQQEQLKMMFVEAKWLVNDVLRFSENPEQKIWDYPIQKEVQVRLKDGIYETRKLNFISSQMKQSVVAEMVSNIKTLSTLKKQGKKVGRLKFRSEVRELNLKQFGNTYSFKNHSMKIQGVKGLVRVNGLDQFINDNYEYANAKLLNTPKGYYVAVTTYKKKENVSKTFKPEIGIDMGCETSITISDGRKINASVQETERLRRLQREMFKREKGSKNRAKTIHKIRREYQNITNQKNDMANKIVHNLLEHEKVYMQDENLKGWHRSGHGKKVQHSVLGRVKVKLISNPRVVILDKWVPTTQFCSKCGHKTPHPQEKRNYVCEYCGETGDRDVHAAQNMIFLGQDERNLVGVGRTKLTPVDIGSLVQQALSNEGFEELSPVVEAGRSHPLGWG